MARVISAGRAEAADRVRRCAVATGLPGFEVGTSYGTPALIVGKKSITRMKDDETLVLMTTPGDKELLMTSAPDIYFETDHYKGWPYVLVHLVRITDAELGLRLGQAWHLAAPKKLRDAAPGKGRT